MSMITPVGLSAKQKAVVKDAMALVNHVPEDRGPNKCSTTAWFQSIFGWGDGYPWCAMNADRIGYAAGVIVKQDMSAGAWALNNHLASLHNGRPSKPEVAATQAYNWGTGHIEVIVALDTYPSYDWCVGGNTGSGNPAEGDGCYLVRRYLPGQLYSPAPWARFPGIANDSAASVPVRSWATVQQGSTGSNVKRVQVVVHVKQDGVFGAATKAAVVQFQKNHGLVTDGVVGINTATKMGLVS